MMPPIGSSGGQQAMTYVDEVEVRRTSVGTKVLAFACAIFAVLGSFWAIVWFIRAYVEAPRVNIPAPLMLASSESRPAPALPPKVEAPVTSERAPAPPIIEAQARPGSQAKPAPLPPVPPAPTAAPREPPASAADAVADRWSPINQLVSPLPAPVPPPAPAAAQAEPSQSDPVTTATVADAEPAIEEVAERSVPAIAGPAPLPRPKPTVTAAVRSRVETTPLPRPRPDGPAPASVWTGVPSSDERFSGQ
jgi:hypothetical protein